MHTVHPGHFGGMFTQERAPASGPACPRGEHACDLVATLGRTASCSSVRGSHLCTTWRGIDGEHAQFDGRTRASGAATRSCRPSQSSYGQLRRLLSTVSRQDSVAADLRSRNFCTMSPQIDDNTGKYSPTAWRLGADIALVTRMVTSTLSNVVDMAAIIKRFSSWRAVGGTALAAQEGSTIGRHSPTGESHRRPTNRRTTIYLTDSDTVTALRSFQRQPRAAVHGIGRSLTPAIGDPAPRPSGTFGSADAPSRSATHGQIDSRIGASWYSWHLISCRGIQPLHQLPGIRPAEGIP